MNSISRQIRRPTQRAIAAFMMLWLSGVVLLFCCGTMQARATQDEFCPLAAKSQSHCNKAKASNDLPTFSKASNYQFDCCAFLPALFDKARKIEKAERIALLSDKVKVDLPKYSFVKIDFEIAGKYHPGVSAREKIFIKNCVFRI